MKIEKSGIRVILSKEDMDVLIKARDMLEKINDEIEVDMDRDIPCKVITEDGLEMNTEDLWGAYTALDDILND